MAVRKNPIICIGAALIDESYICHAQPVSGTSNPAAYYRSAGGVARNIAGHLSLLGHQVELITHFGSDPGGKWLMNECLTCGIGITHAIINDVETGRFAAVLSPDGDLFAGAVSTHFEEQINPDFLRQKTDLLKSASLLLVDTNLNAYTLKWLLNFSRNEHIPCIIEPVSVPKAARLLKADLREVLLITPNHDEMLAISGNSGETNTNALISEVLEKGVKFIWIRNGKHGSGIFAKNYSYKLDAPVVNVTDTTGAGDAGLAGWIHAWLMNRSIEECVRYGHAMSALVLEVKGAMRAGLNFDLLEETYLNYK